MVELWNGDCLNLMRDIHDGSVDMILTDLPYGTTSCHWDSVIPFEPLWEQYDRIIKRTGAVVLFGTQPFTSKLICSNIANFKYCWTWDKGRVGGYTSAKLRPLKLFEDICVFSNGKIANCCKNNMVYYPQGLVEVNKTSRSSTDHTATGYARPSQTKFYFQKYTNYPKQLIKFPLDRDRIHPTQKPVALLEYLIRTYTAEGDVVLDSCAGSMSTVIACLNTKRDCIAIEKDPGYFDAGCDRVQKYINDHCSAVDSNNIVKTKGIKYT